MRNTANETVMQTVAEPSELEQSMSRLRRLRKGCKLLSEHQPCDRGSAVDIHDLITDEIIRVSDVLLTRPPTDLASMKAVAELLLWLADEADQDSITSRLSASLCHAVLSLTRDKGSPYDTR